MSTEENLKVILAYKRLFDCEDGKFVLEDLKKRAHVYVPTYSGNVNDALVNEGKRQIVLTIDTLIGFNLDLLPKENGGNVNA